MAFREDCNYKWPCTQTGVCSWLDRNCRKWLYWSGIQWRVYCAWKWGIAVFLLLVCSEIRLENAVDEHSSGKNQHDKQTLSFSLFFPSLLSLLFNNCCLPLPFLISRFYYTLDFATDWNPALHGKNLPNFCSAYMQAQYDPSFPI
jgi:hypothetical protein